MVLKNFYYEVFQILNKSYIPKNCDNSYIHVENVQIYPINPYNLDPFDGEIKNFIKYLKTIQYFKLHKIHISLNVR